MRIMSSHKVRLYPHESERHKDGVFYETKGSGEIEEAPEWIQNDPYFELNRKDGRILVLDEDKYDLKPVDATTLSPQPQNEEQILALEAERARKASGKKWDPNSKEEIKE